MKPGKPDRSKLPDTRMSLTHRKECCGFKLYVTVTFFDDGANPNLDDAVSPCEVFCKIAKQGSVVAGLMDGVCGPVSIALQHGIHWDTVSKPLRHHTFEQKNDPNHTSLLDGLVQCVDRLIVDQCDRIGVEFPPGQHYQKHFPKTATADNPHPPKLEGASIDSIVMDEIVVDPSHGKDGGNKTMISDGHIFYDDGSVWIMASKQWKERNSTDHETAPAKG